MALFSNNEFQTYLGKRVDGGPPVAVKLYEVTHKTKGTKWELWIGNAQQAIRISRFGVVNERQNSPKVTHLINCAVKAGSQYRRIEMRDDIVYAAVSTNDWPEPEIGTVNGDLEKPNWTSALACCRNSIAELEHRDICLYVHCVYGKNRSAITCALILKTLFGNQDSNVSTIDNAITNMTRIKPDIDVMYPYKEWGKEFTGEIIKARARRMCRVINCNYCDPGISHYCKVCKTHGVTHFSRHCPLKNIVNNDNGCSVILLKDYYIDGAYKGLTAYVIYDHTSNYCFPTESRDAGENSITCAYRALYEELHVHEISEQMLVNPILFECIPESQKSPNVYISRLSLQDSSMINFTKLDFSARRKTYEKMRQEGQPRYLWHCFLETGHMENLLVEPLLQKTPSSITPQGKNLELRNVAKNILFNSDVRKRLQKEVEKSKKRNGIV